MITWGGMGEAEGKGRQARRAMERPSPVSLLCVCCYHLPGKSLPSQSRGMFAGCPVVTQQSSKCDLLPPTRGSRLRWYLAL